MGPVANRSCTDVLFMLLFLGSLVLYAAVAYLSFNQGDPSRYVIFQFFTCTFQAFRRCRLPRKDVWI